VTVEKNIECMHLSKVMYVRFGCLYIYVFVFFEKEDSGNINPWWWRLRIGHGEGTWEDMSCCSPEYKYKSLGLSVMVSDMARVRGKMCVTCRSPTTRTATILITPTPQRLDHRWASYSLSRLLACWAPSDPLVSLDLRSVSHPPQVCTSSVSGVVPF
jgi:hypothetical protein